MTFTYSGDPSSSPLEEIRFYIQDTDYANPYMTDEELQFLYDTWYPLYKSNVYVAYVAANSLAALFAREVSYSADGVSVSGDQLQGKYKDLAAGLREMWRASQGVGGPNAGGVIAGETLGGDVVPMSFSKGMDDNPLAGQQEFGGTTPKYREPEIDGSY